MKKLFLMLGFVGATMFAFSQEKTETSVPAADPNAPEFKWEQTTIDYGTVNKGDENSASREFKFTNVGKAPLVISSCHGSCGCTVPTCPTEPVLPGKSGAIKVHYDINRVGPFTKTVTVNSNAKNPNETLKITGTVQDSGVKPNEAAPAVNVGTSAPAATKTAVGTSATSPKK